MPKYFRGHIPEGQVVAVYDLLEKVGAKMAREGKDVMNVQRNSEVISFSRVFLHLLAEAAERRGFDGESVL